MQNDAIKKPITLLREDFINSFLELCNSSGLPFFVIEDFLKGFMSDVSAAAQRQLKMDKEQYENELKKQEELKAKEENKGTINE